MPPPPSVLVSTVSGNHARSAVAALALVCLAITFWANFSFRHDDAHITFVYSRNLADGLGFVFNPGDRTLSTTTPLMAMLMAVPSLLGLDLPIIAIGLSTVAVGLIAAILVANIRPLTSWAAVAVMLPVATLQPFFIGTMANELLPYVALAVIALHQLARGRFVSAASAAAFSALMRPDGVLVVAIVLVVAVWRVWQRHGSSPRRVRAAVRGIRGPAAVVLAIGGSWVVFATAYFGSPIPVTLEAKRAQRDLGLGQSFVELLRTGFGGLARQPRFALATVLVVLGLASAVAWSVRWKRQRLGIPAEVDVYRSTVMLLLAWNLIYAACYSVLDVNAAYGWYLAPLGVSVAIAVALGAQATIDCVSRVGSPVTTRTAALVLGLAIFGSSVHFADQIRNRDPGPRALYPDTGRWIARNVPPEATVGTLEIGLIGYEAHRTIIDFAGLLQPGIVADAPVGQGYDGAALIAWERYDPDFVAVLWGGFADLLDDDRFQAECEIATSISHNDTDAVMNIWDCRGG